MSEQDWDISFTIRDNEHVKAATKKEAIDKFWNRHTEFDERDPRIKIKHVRELNWCNKGRHLISGDVSECVLCELEEKTGLDYSQNQGAPP
jgi:hypothetical protein